MNKTTTANRAELATILQGTTHDANGRTVYPIDMGAVYRNGEQYGPAIHPRNLLRTFDIVAEEHPTAIVTFTTVTL